MPYVDPMQVALETAIAADGCDDRDIFVPLVETAFRQLQADVHLIVKARASRQGPQMEIGFGRTSPAWETRYRAAHHDRRDPLVRRLLRSTELLAWSDLDGRGDLSEAEVAVIGEGRAFGFEDAIIAPQQQPGGGAAAVLLLRRGLDGRDARRRQAVRTLSNAYFRTARRLGLTRSRSPSLSPREIETLYHVHLGQSDKAAARACSCHRTRWRPTCDPPGENLVSRGGSQPRGPPSNSSFCRAIPWTVSHPRERPTTPDRPPRSQYGTGG